MVNRSDGSRHLGGTITQVEPMFETLTCVGRLAALPSPAFVDKAQLRTNFGTL